MAKEQAATDSAAAPVASPKIKDKGAATPKAAATTAKSSTGEKKVAAHPSTVVMVMDAVTKLAEKGGSSLQAIKKYLSEIYKVDIDKLNLNIRKAVKKLVETGKLAQPKGTGATGSFKLPSKPKPEKKPAAVKKPKMKLPKTLKKAAAPTAKTAKKAAPKVK